MPLSSDLCVNVGEAVVGDSFWSNEVSQGITVSPNQLIFLNPFITFPQPTGLIPFNFEAKALDGFSDDAIYALIEADLLPLLNHPVPALEVTIVSEYHKYPDCVTIKICKCHSRLDNL